MLLHLSHHMQHLLVLCIRLSLHLSPAAPPPPVLHVSASKCRPLALISVLPSKSYLSNTVLDAHSSSSEQTWVCHLGKYPHEGQPKITKVTQVYFKADAWQPTGMLATVWTACHQRSPHSAEGSGSRQNVLFQFKQEHALSWC